MIANKTSSGEELIEHLRAKAADGDSPRASTCSSRSSPSRTAAATRRARRAARLARMLDRLHGDGLLSSGMIGDPDPYTAAINALELFRVDDVVISTLPDERSGWLRANLIERVQHATSAPVEHVVVDLQPTDRRGGRPSREPMEAASIAHAVGHGEHEHHGPPPANRSSRVEPQLWGCCFSSSPR